MDFKPLDQRGKLMRKIHVSDARGGDQRHLSILLAMRLEPMHMNRDLYAHRGCTKQIAKQGGVRDGI